MREIRNAFPSVPRLVQNGYTVAMTSRRKVVANLSPPPTDTKKPQRPWTDLDEHFDRLQPQPAMKVTGAELLAGSRDGY